MRDFLDTLIDQFQAKFPPTKLVTAAMVLLGAPLAALGGWFAAWAPLHLPGLPHFTGGQVTAILITASSGVLLLVTVAGYKALDIWQERERHQQRERLALIEQGHHDPEAMGAAPPVRVPPRA